MSSDVASIEPEATTPSSQLMLPSPTEAQAPNPPAVDVPPALTDAQILEVTHTANQGEVEQAKLAQSKSRDPRVKRLAAMMLTDHTAADDQGRAVARKASLVPEPSPISTSLASDAHGATSDLKAQVGSEFDKGYVDTQVKEHQAVLDMIDQKLLPAALNGEVRAYLAEVRPKIAMHLRRAQELQSAMQK